MQIALKEWAVAIEAMARGVQGVLVRKGGIREETRDFRVEHDRFLLYPTYEHQRADLLQEPFQASLAGVLAAWTGPETVTISTWAEVTDSFTVTDQESVARLAPYYVYTEDYAAERLRWRPRKPLHVLLTRVYALPAPVTLPVVAAYGGCRSWLTLERDIETPRAHPVLDDAAFDRLRAHVRAALADAGAAAIR
jgi:hypothetical protein